MKLLQSLMKWPAYHLSHSFEWYGPLHVATRSLKGQLEKTRSSKDQNEIGKNEASTFELRLESDHWNWKWFKFDEYSDLSFIRWVQKS